MRCLEVVRFLEGPLSEVPLYILLFIIFIVILYIYVSNAIIIKL